MSIIKVDRVSKLYRTSEIETLALENVNFTIDKGEFVSVMGPSGCGKSTLLNIVGLLDKPTQGTVEIAGTDPTGLRDSKLAAFRNANIGFIFQNFHLIPSLNVADNVALPLLYRKNAPSGSKRQELIRDVLEKVGLTHRQRHYPSQLSGGQCQRVAIARAIIGNPSIILADEPTGNLDSKMSAEIMEILHKLNREEQRTILMVTHNQNIAEMANTVIRMNSGKISEIYTNVKQKTAYEIGW